MLAKQLSNNPTLAIEAGLGSSNNAKSLEIIQNAHTTPNNLPKKVDSIRNSDQTKERSQTKKTDEQERGRYSSDS